MLTLFKREMRSLFTSYRGYAFMAAFFIGILIVRMVYHYFFIAFPQFVYYDAEYGTALSLAAFEYVLGYLPVAFALAAPLMTAGMFSEERRKETTGFLRSLPLNTNSLFFGKYLSVLSVTLVGCAAVTALNWVLGFYSGRYLLPTVVSILSYVLVCHALLSVYLLIAAACKKKGSAYGISYGVSAVFIILFTFRNSVPEVLRGAFALLSVIGTYEQASVGVLDIPALVFQVTLSAACIYVAHTLVKKEIRL